MRYGNYFSKMRILFFILLLACNQTAKGQFETHILNAFGKADIQRIYAHFDKNVEICIGDEVEFYPKNIAKEVLNAFFKKVRPVKCTPLHKGESSDHSSKYIIGKLEAQKGTFRLFVFAIKKSGKQLIKEVRLEKF